MKVGKIILVVTALFILPLSSVYAAALISGVTVASVSNSYPTFNPNNLVNGAGLNTSNSPATHSAAPDDSIHWETMYYQNSAEIIFDLNDVYTVAGMNIWNFNYVNSNGDYSGRGFKDVTISTSLNNIDWNIQGNFVFPHAPGTNDYIGTYFSDLNWSNARYIRFFASSIWGYGDVGGHFGLSEVRFYKEDSTNVPEPSTLSLLLIGSAFLRRKKQK